MSSLQVDFERAAPAGAALEPADEYVEFWYTGAIARGLFLLRLVWAEARLRSQAPELPEL